MTTPKAESIEARVKAYVTAFRHVPADDLHLPDAADFIELLAAENAALLARAEAAEGERDRQYDENVNRIYMQAKAELELDEAKASIGAAWCEGRDAAKREAESARATAVSFGLGEMAIGASQCKELIANLTPPPDAAAALQRAKDAEWNAAVDACAGEIQTQGDSAATEALGQRLCCTGQHCGCQGSTVEDWLLHCIRALRKEGTL